VSSGSDHTYCTVQMLYIPIFLPIGEEAPGARTNLAVPGNIIRCLSPLL
jgi:hypothetical protein